MLNEDILKYKYDLVVSDTYKKLRELEVNYIIDKANSQLSAETLRGMLLLINERDRWEKEYISACKKRGK